MNCPNVFSPVKAAFFDLSVSFWKLVSRRTQSSFCAFFLILTLIIPTNAMAQNWVVKRVSGIAYFVAPGVDAFRVKRGMVFEKGYTLGTRAGARALLTRCSETISVGPNTTFALSRYRSGGGKTTLLQRKGTIEVDVLKRQRPHFSVETPFFAAVGPAHQSLRSVCHD